MSTANEIEQLIGRVALQDRAAFQLLYSHTSAKLFGVCLRVLNNRAEAEDALQEVFIKIWRSAGRYNVNGLSPMTWLITVARNHAIDVLRKRKAKATTGDMDAVAMMADPAPGPEALTIKASEAGQVAGCLEALPVDRAEAVKRAYMQGETYADLAERFGVPLNTMRTWLRRSLIQLKECLSG